MKKYEYNSKRFKWKVTYSGIIGLLAFLLSLIQIILGSKNLVWIAGVIVGLYTFWEVYISVSNPKIVEVDDSSISFSAYGKTHKYDFSEIKNFKVKEFVQAKKVFVRINDPGIFKGRYWVNCYFFNDSDELFHLIRDLEYRFEPDTLKAKARRDHEEDLKRRLEIKKKGNQKK